MSNPYELAFLGILAVYIGWSAWTHLDPRIPILSAAVLLIVTAFVDAAGASATAGRIVPFVFYMAVGGVFLLLYEHVRSLQARSPESPEGPHTEGGVTAEP